MTRLYKATTRFLKNESGASLIEYSILIGIITIGAITSIVAMGGKVSGWWGRLVSETPPATAPSTTPPAGPPSGG